MDINVKNVDMAYEQCANLHKTMNSQGGELVVSLTNNITKLKSDWIASDATAHINNLIDLQNYLCGVFTNSTEVVAYAASKIIDIQEVRRANHGGMGAVGTQLNVCSFDKYSGGYAADTAEYQAASSALLADLNDLKSIFDSYNSLITTFVSQKDELFANWLNGANIERARQVFNDFESTSEKYRGILNAAIENLTKATSNVSQIAN